MIGAVFGKLTVSAEADSRRIGNRIRRHWICTCICGRSRIASEPELKRGRVSGCDKRGGIQHGPEYNSYTAMKARCYQRGNKDFHNYGGRGVSVCSRWLVGEDCRLGFECFLMDMGKRPTSNHSIDRIDCDGNYEPSNCRWATSLEQAQNKRNVRCIVLNGATVPLATACRDYKLPYSVVLARIDRYGMAVEDALTRPLYARRTTSTIVYAERNR